MNEVEMPGRESQHDTESVVRDLARKLASRERHVCILVGAGASVSAGDPTLTGLQDLVVDQLRGNDGRRLQRLPQARNSEQVLRRLRRLAAVLDEDEEVGGLTADGARDLDQQMRAAVMIGELR